SELKTRILSGIVLAAAALGTAWAGGILFVLFWLVAAAGIFLEWWKLTGASVGWKFPGFVYASIAFAAPVILRMDIEHGLAAVLWLFAVVWGSDVMAYFCGRAIGGPKLWPAVSPKTTWSGFVGGTAFGTAAAVGVAAGFGAPALLPVGVVSAVGAIV